MTDSTLDTHKPEASIAEADSNESLGRLQNFPVSFFSIIMGLSGFTIAWEKVAHLLKTHIGFESYFAWGTLGIFVLIALVYLAKIIRYPQAVVAELKHPVKLSFFPAFSIALLLLAIAMIPQSESLAEGLWIAGTAIHLVLFLYVVNSWMHHEHYQPQHISPAWFIPAVGNVLVPIAGMHFGYVEISWFFFSIGIMFWIILFTIFFNRILFHNPLPTHLVPTFFILIAPPAVGFVSYMKLNGGLDNFAHILYYIGLFLTLLLFSQFKKFFSLPFFLSWWAYSFPIAAITIASLLMYQLHQKVIYAYIGGFLLSVLTLIIALLIFKTIMAISKKKVCVETH